MGHILKFDGISKSYGNQKVLDNISLTVDNICVVIVKVTVDTHLM